MIDCYNILGETAEWTVAEQYERERNEVSDYQSESALEQELIARLVQQGYESVAFHSESELIGNLRHEIELLNGTTYSDSEWDVIFSQHIANANNGIREKSRMIQENNYFEITRDDGKLENVWLIDKKYPHRNSLQVMHQYAVESSKAKNRYDVTILVNGLPMVHIELKRRGVAIREAFNQINRYQRDSFWSGSGLFEYVQIFIISNGTHTKYYSNTTRDAHIREASNGNNTKTVKTSHSFEFTMWWADQDNKQIQDLRDFTRTFLSKHTLLNILTRYCVFTVDDTLLVMRPYQITATEKILSKIVGAYNSGKCGTRDAGGYIWHTTGSGKTLTSFKTAQLATKLPFIDKVLFVVDRKDLDYQTMKEYNKFQEGAANSNSNTQILRRQLLSHNPNERIIITTIQKLSRLLNNKNDSELNEVLKSRQTVLIFDECHRSQFGSMRQLIDKRFKKSYAFGFTGTPIFAENANHYSTSLIFTTEQLFGQCLHRYTIVDAIRDKNVLRFFVDYVRTVREKEDIEDKEVWGIQEEKALLDERRINNITQYIFEHFDQKTKRKGKSYQFNKITNVAEVVRNRNAHEKRQTVYVQGFNSIFAVSSIKAARMYYEAFKQKNAELTPDKRLRVATIFSYCVNQDVEDGIDIVTGLEEENNENISQLSETDRDFLNSAIDDYNAMFGTSFASDDQRFQNYYKDVSMRMKNREVDLLIVVNMFLTGFDAKTLNTLWVDKGLRDHGLIQAFSRTNRILNSVKDCGNIVCFRNLAENTDNALRLFGDKEGGGIVRIRKFEDYYTGYVDDGGKEHKGYQYYIDVLLNEFSLDKMSLETDEEKRNFIKLFGHILKMQNLLSAFDQFEDKKLISDFAMQDYMSIYNDLYDEFTEPEVETENVNDDLVFEMELMKQVQITIDYILKLIREMHEEQHADRELALKDNIKRAINSSPELRKKRDLILEFVNRLTPESDVDETWENYVDEQLECEQDTLIERFNLKAEQTRELIKRSFYNGYVETAGSSISDILPPMRRFGGQSNRWQTELKVTEAIEELFERYHDLVSVDIEYIHAPE